MEKFESPKDPAKGAGKTKGKGTGGKGKGKSLPGAQNKTEEQLKELRASRLEALKTGAPPGEKEPTPTATQEVAIVFNDTSTGTAAPPMVVLEKDLVEGAEQIATKAKAVVASLQAEHYPSKKELPSADETLTKLLQSVRLARR